MLGMQESVLNDWATANGFKIVSVKPGPYSSSRVLFSTRSQQEFRITVRDKYGVLKSGLARCVRTGVRSAGVQVDVRWDD